LLRVKQTLLQQLCCNGQLLQEGVHAVTTTLEGGTAVNGHTLLCYKNVIVEAATVSPHLYLQQSTTGHHHVACCKLRCCCHSNRPKRLLVFVNPFGGRRQAPKVWQQVAAPVLAAVGAECEVVETTCQARQGSSTNSTLP
jgi:hypothetical protein